MQVSQEISASEEALYAKVAWRIIPLLFLSYIFAYLDRVNVSFAKLQIQTAVPEINDSIYGWGAGIFFLGYFLFEVPSNILMEKVGPRLWIARIMVSWGIVSSAMVLVNSAWLFCLFRLVLGLAEAGFFPGMILYLTFWFPSRMRARMVALFMLAVALTGVIGAPLSGWILRELNGFAGFKGWQMLFLIEGIPSILLGLSLPFLLADGIESAAWLSEEEKRLLSQNLEKEERLKEPLPFAQIFFDPRLIGFSLIYFCCVMGLYGTGFWIPQLIKNTGVNDPLQIGLLTAIPYGFGAIAMVAFGRSSDRSGERRLHFFAASLLGAGGIVFSNFHKENTLLAMIGLTIATIGILSSFPLFWPMPTAMLTGGVAAAGIAWINSLGNLAGFFGPSIVGWVTDLTKRSDYGLYVIAASLAFGAVFTLFFLPKRDANYAGHPDA